MKKFIKKENQLKKLAVIGILTIAVASTVSGCKPSYKSPFESPATETMSADEPYDTDFIQVNNNVIDTYSSGDRAKIFRFIKNLEIDGSNDEKYVSLTLDVDENTSEEALNILLSDLTKQISDEGQMQDFRFQPSSSTSFGTFFDVYNYKVKVTRGSETLMDETIKTNEGESIPFDPALGLDTVMSALASQVEESTSGTSDTTTGATN